MAGEAEGAVTTDENTTHEPCRWCGEQKPKAYPYCNSCKNFVDWRRFFSFSTPVLGLLVALVSVAGLNFSTLLERLYPPRASLLFGATYLSDSAIEVTATNIGATFGYVGDSLTCSADDHYLVFRAPAPVGVQARETTKFTVKPASIFWEKYTDVLRDPAETNSDELMIASEWKCRLDAYDAHGKTRGELVRDLLYVYLDGRRLGGYFSGPDG